MCPSALKHQERPVLTHSSASSRAKGWEESERWAGSGSAPRMRKAARRAHAARYYQSCKARSGPVRKVKVPATNEREERCAWAARDRQGASLESEAAPTARTAKVMQVSSCPTRAAS
ncbi:hypothetical protein NN561_014101 [Cricetulus griseus]